MGTGFGIGQGMMVTSQVITTGCGNRLQLMVRQIFLSMQMYEDSLKNTGSQNHYNCD
jgi:hypothetical protein